MENELFDIEVKKNILDIAYKYHNSKTFTRNDYLISCMREIAKSIKNRYNEHFQYFDLFMLEYGKFTNIANVDFEILKEFSNSKLLPAIEFGKHKIQKGEVRSFVKLMNRQIKNGIVLYENDNFEVDEFSKKTDAFCFNIKDSIKVNYENRCDKFEDLFNLIKRESTVNQSALLKLFNHLGVHHKEIKDYTDSIKIQKLYPLVEPNLNAYFIRPRIANIHFNGVFYLQVTTPLSFRHFNEIVEILTQIYCEVALWRSRSELSKSIYRDTSDEYSHYLKHEFGAINTLINDVSAEIGNNGSLEVVKNRLLHITKLNDFHLWMARTSEVENKEIIHDKKLKKDKHFNSLDSVSLRGVLSNSLDTIEKTFTLFNIYKVNQPKYKLLIENLKVSIRTIPKVYLDVSGEGLYLLLIESLKNAIENSISVSPEISFKWGLYDEKHYFFKVENNCIESTAKIHVNALHKVTNKRTQIGLKTIKKIIDFKHFNKSEFKWHLLENTRISNNKKTYIKSFTFLIPKADVFV